MLARYSGSVGAGAVITAALIFSMQQLISGDEDEFRPARRLDDIRILPRIEPPPPTPPRQPPTPPQPTTNPPALPSIGPAETTSSSRSSRRIDGLPSLRAGTGPLGPSRGGPGFGAMDGELVPMARVEPLYPRLAESRGLEGRVLVEFTVTADGSVSGASVIESTDRLFEDAALAAVARFRYQPRVVDGQAVAVAGVRTEFSFRLEN